MWRYPPARPGAVFGLALAVCIQWTPPGRRLCFGACPGDLVYSDGLPIGVALFLAPAWAFLLAAAALMLRRILRGGVLFCVPLGDAYFSFATLPFNTWGFEWDVFPRFRLADSPRLKTGRALKRRGDCKKMGNIFLVFAFARRPPRQ